MNESMSEQNAEKVRLTNAQAALMAAVEVEKSNGTTYRYRGQRERAIEQRAAYFLAFLDAQKASSLPPAVPSAVPPAPGFTVQCRENDPTRCTVSCSAYRAGYDECTPLSSTSEKR